MRELSLRIVPSVKYCCICLALIRQTPLDYLLKGTMKVSVGDGCVVDEEIGLELIPGYKVAVHSVRRLGVAM